MGRAALSSNTETVASRRTGKRCFSRNVRAAGSPPFFWRELFHGNTTNQASLPEGSREFLTEMRGLTVDVHGREHLVGLTVEESVWYLKAGSHTSGE